MKKLETGNSKMEIGNSKLETGNSKLENRNSKIVRWTQTLWVRFSHFAFRFSALLTRLPWRLVLGAACLVLLAVWLHEHDARLRRDLELKQLKQQTSAAVADLRARAEAAIREANQKNARAIADLEARRRQLEREGGELQKRLAALGEQERQRVSAVAALPLQELARRLESRVPGLGTRGSGAEEQVLGVRGQGPGVGERVSRERLTDRQSASPQETRGLPDSRHLASDALQSASERHLAADTESSPDSEFQIPNAELRIPDSEPRAPGLEFLITEEGARRIETAFVELDSCRAQSAVKDRALANCEEQVAVNRAVTGAMNKSVNDLNQALRLKDEIQARLEAQHRAELKAARGSRLRRFGRAVQYVAAGVVVGIVLAR